CTGSATGTRPTAQIGYRPTIRPRVCGEGLAGQRPLGIDAEQGRVLAADVENNRRRNLCVLARQRGQVSGSEAGIRNAYVEHLGIDDGDASALRVGTPQVLAGGHGRSTRAPQHVPGWGAYSRYTASLTGV